MARAHHDGEERSQVGDEDDASLAGGEEQDGERYPSDCGDGADHFEDRPEEVGDEPGPGHRHADDHPAHRGQDEARQDAAQAGSDVGVEDPRGERAGELGRHFARGGQFREPQAHLDVVPREQLPGAHGEGEGGEAEEPAPECRPGQASTRGRALRLQPRELTLARPRGGTQGRGSEDDLGGCHVGLQPRSGLSLSLFKDRVRVRRRRWPARRSRAWIPDGRRRSPRRRRGWRRGAGGRSPAGWGRTPSSRCGRSCGCR